MNKEKQYLKKLKRKNIIINIIRLLLISSFILLWEILSSKKIINSFIFSSPSKIINTIISLYKQNILFENIMVTTKEILISFILGFILSILIASIFYLSDVIYKIFDPIITIINSLPKVALGPILLIWFGANQKTIIIMALLINLIVSIITIYTGFIKTDQNLTKLFKSYKVNKLKTLFYLVIPNSKKNIISSLKLNISMSLIGLLPPVGEKIFFNKCYSRYLFHYHLL